MLYDANVLYPSTLRDLLIRVAQAGLVQAKWTDRILDEVFDALSANRPDLDSQRLARTRSLLNAAVRDLVTGMSPSSRRSIADPDDRHVLAAAIRARAQVIVTNNLKGLPAHDSGSVGHGNEASDDFILDQIDLSREAVHAPSNASPIPRSPSDFP